MSLSDWIADKDYFELSTDHTADLRTAIPYHGHLGTENRATFSIGVYTGTGEVVVMKKSRDDSIKSWIGLSKPSEGERVWTILLQKRYGKLSYSGTGGALLGMMSDMTIEKISPKYFIPFDFQARPLKDFSVSRHNRFSISLNKSHFELGFEHEEEYLMAKLNEA